MATRETLENLITRVRTMIGDTQEEVSNDELQEILDNNRRDVKYLPLRQEQFLSPGGTVTYLDFYSPIGGDWEEDTVVYSNVYEVLTPDSIDYQVGKWSFLADQGTKMPLFLVGKKYDINGAAADACERWAVRISLEQDVQDAGITTTWMNKQSQLLRAAKVFRSHQRLLRSKICASR